MSEPSESDLNNEVKELRSWRTWFKYGCLLPVVVIAILTLIVLFLSRRFENKVITQLESDIQVLESRLFVKNRQPLFGQAEEGNALKEYTAIPAVLGHPLSWETKTPSFAISPITKKFSNGSGPKWEKLNHRLQEVRDLRRWTLNPKTKKPQLSRKSKSRPSSSLSSQELIVFKTYLPLVAHIKSGLQKSNLNWGQDFRKGMAVEIPSILHLIFVCNLMLENARSETPREAIKTCLQGLSFSRDLAKHGTLIGAVSGIRIGTNCLAELEQQLCHQLSKADYQFAFDNLNKVPTLSVQDTIDVENLGVQATLIQLAGRSLTEQPEIDANQFTGVDRMQSWRIKLMLRNEIRAYRTFIKGVKAAAKLPRVKRIAEIDRLSHELQDSWASTASMVAVNFNSAITYFENHKLAIDAMRIVLAAQLYRCDNGSFPDKLEALASYFDGKLPVDTSMPPGTNFQFGITENQFWLASQSDQNLRYSTIDPSK